MGLFTYAYSQDTLSLIQYGVGALGTWAAWMV